MEVLAKALLITVAGWVTYEMVKPIYTDRVISHRSTQGSDVKASEWKPIKNTNC